MLTLQNVFGYLRDLYHTGVPILNFEQEPNNSKIINRDYFTFESVEALVAEAQKGRYNELNLDWSQLPDGAFLRIKRIVIPEIKLPADLEGWVVLPKNPTEKPIIPTKTAQKIHKFVPFGQSPARVAAFAELEKVYADWAVAKQQTAESDLQKIIENTTENTTENETTNSETISNEQTNEIQMPTPTIPDILKGWVSIVKNEQKEDEPKKIEYSDEIELFEQNSLRVSVFANFEIEYKRFYEIYWTAICINRQYDMIHSLYYDLRGKENKRLFISFGLVTGKIGGYFYRNFLFHIPLRLTLKNQEISLQLDTFANKIFAEQFLSEILAAHFPFEAVEIVEARKNQMLTAIDNFNQQPNEFFWDAEHLHATYYETAQQILSAFANTQSNFFENGQIDTTYKADTDANTINLSFSPILQSKISESELLIAKDAANILRKIEELERENKLDTLPQFFQKLLKQDSLAPVLNPEIAPVNVQTASRALHNFLFPLPYNAEQLAIAEKLKTQDAVTVKGPPGTGKSHTIANLVANYVAQGKTILIVSQNAKALSVIKDKLPQDLQELTVSLVNQASNDTLKHSVNAIITHLSKAYTSDDVHLREQKLEGVQTRYDYVLSEIYAAIGGNARELRLQNPVTNEPLALTAYEWARYLTTQFDDEKIAFTEKISPALDTTTWAEQFLQTVRAADFAAAEDFWVADFNYLKPEIFIAPNELKAQIETLQNLKTGFNAVAYSKVEPSLLTPDFLELVKALQEDIEEMPRYAVANALLYHQTYNAQFFLPVFEKISVLHQTILEKNQSFLMHNFDLSALQNMNVQQALRAVDELITRFGSDDELNFFSKFGLGNDARKLMQCKVDNLECTHQNEVQLLRSYLEHYNNLAQLSTIITNYLGSFFGEPTLQAVITSIQMPMITVPSTFVLAPLNQTVNHLQVLLDTQKSIDVYNNLAKLRKLPAFNPQERNAEANWQFILGLHQYNEYRKASAELSALKQQLLTAPKQPPIVLQIADAISDLDVKTYTEQLQKYNEMRLKAQRLTQYNEHLNRLRKSLPQTAERLHQGLLSGEKWYKSLDEESINLAIFKTKIAHFVTESLRDIVNADAYLEQLHSLKHEIQRCTADLVALKTWYNKSKSITDTEKSALTAWLNDLTNIGKGFGKNTMRNRASAVQNMQIAKGAVPIWIMQLTNAITFFPDTQPNQFDVLIIDEASQCDMSSLNLMFRCKKTVVVGDENQTAVTMDNSKFGIEKVNVLLDRHFTNHPFKQQFNVNNKNNSIYSLSSVIYPNIITLVEHFRCQPEIIGYSNQHVYNNLIVPLKTAAARPFGAPIRIEYLPLSDDDLYAQDEAHPQIVQRCVDIILQYIDDFDTKKIEKLPSIGVLALDSSNIKHQRLLVREILQHTKIAVNADALNIAIGTAREFQGDERDVMLLTVSVNYAGEVPRAVASEEYMRLYNVAASRAREVSVVLHSIPPEAVAAINPLCYRKKLIDYYTITQNVVQQGTDNTRAGLENRLNPSLGMVGKELLSFFDSLDLLPYLHPQFKIGSYKIEFAIIKDNQKFGVECDMANAMHEKDNIETKLEHQQILERAGWKMFRLQATEWCATPDIAKNKLKTFLAQYLG
jgi:REase_MTES_1575/AAA domain